MTQVFSIEVTDGEVRGLLNRLLKAAGPAGMAPAMREIGEDLVESHQQRFVTSTAPDGSRWLANARATIEAYVNRAKGVLRKDGRLNKKGATRAAAKKPLVDSGLLADTFHYQLSEGGAVLDVGTNRFAGQWPGGAAVLHYGSKDGTIPARPFVGVSEQDRPGIIGVLNRHFLAAAAR